MVLGERDATRARAIARANLKVYLRLPNYQRNLRAFGMEDSDFAAGGSDRLVDQIVVWGDDDDAIRQRIQDHFDAGADHVCIQPFRARSTTRSRHGAARAARPQSLLSEEIDRHEFPVVPMATEKH